MYREIAQTLEETAVKQLASLGDCFPEKKQGQANAEKGKLKVHCRYHDLKVMTLCFWKDKKRNIYFALPLASDLLSVISSPWFFFVALFMSELNQGS